MVEDFGGGRPHSCTIASSEDDDGTGLGGVRHGSARVRMMRKKLAARLGFEPRQTDSKSVVLPLHNLATQKHYSTNHLSDAKKCGDEFLGRVFVGSHRARRGRGGIPLSRTEGAEGAEVKPNVIPCRVPAPEAWNLRALTHDFTSYFLLHASYFV